MDLAVITFKQVFVLFLLMLAGVVCTRAGGVHPGDKRAFSDLLLNLVVPAMVVNSYLTEYNPSTGHNLLRAFGWSLLALLAGFAITFFLIRNVRGEQLSIRRFACIFSNAAYMGFPLIESLFGAEGLLYASAYVTMFNLLLWSIGAAMVSGETRRREIAASILRTPVLYAVVAGLIIYFLRIPVPEIIQKPLGLIGAMNTPLFHVHHRNAHCLQQAGTGDPQPSSLGCHGPEDAGHSGRLYCVVCCSGVPWDGRRGCASAGSLPLRGNHLCFCRSVSS